MRVAIVCGGGIVSGKEVMVLQLADGLREAGLTVEVVSSHWGDGRFAARLAELKIATHKVWFGFVSVNLHPRNAYMTLMQLLRWPHLLGSYREFLRRFQPEKVIHTNWHSLLGIWPFLRRSREIYWVHEVMPDKPQYRIVFRRLDRRLRCFVVVSQAVADSLVRLGVKRERIKVIYNGLDTRQFTTRQFAPSELNIGIVGQVGAWKGHEDLLRAFAQVAPDFPAAQLRIYGKGADEYENFLQAEIEGLGLTSRVDWCGYVSDPKEIYRNLGLLVVPSRSADPLPTSAIEAALCGIPVVASSQGGLPEIVEDGQTGFLFPTGDVRAMAERLRQLLRNSEFRQRMGRDARARAERLFTRGRFVQQFRKMLDDEVELG